MAPSKKKPGARPGRLRNIQIRLNPAEAARVEGDLNHFQETSIVAVKPGAYARAAVLAYPRLRKMETDLRNLAKSLRDDKIAARINNLLTPEAHA